MFIYNRRNLFKLLSNVVIVLHGEFKAIFYILFIFKIKDVKSTINENFFHPVEIFTSFTMKIFQVIFL